MSLKLYNTLTNRKEVFEPIEAGKVGIYVCGPTVYKESHIGHAVGPVIFDAFKKYLVHQGYEVKLVINITDVDDKIIAEATRIGICMEELAEQVMANYFECLDQLGVDSVDEFPRATEHIAEIITLIERLIERGGAYASNGDVYFDISQKSDYGKLSNRRIDDQAEGLRELSGKGKRHGGDFALWKSAKADETGWESPWGKGRPGWHIECSAMSMKYLGEAFDIHGGGIDLIFPHHENEIAQSELATGKGFAKYWMHNGLTRLRTKAAGGQWHNEKMAKSLGNIRTIQELLKEYPGETLRFFLLSTQYRSPIDFSDEAIEATQKGMMGLYRLLERVTRMGGDGANVYQRDFDLRNFDHLDKADESDEVFIKQNHEFYGAYFEALEDDFNTAKAIAVLFELCNRINHYMDTHQTEGSQSIAIEASRMVTYLGQILGLFKAPLEQRGSSDGLAEQLMQVLIDLRAQARQDKNFALSDAIRDRLKEIRITLEDRPGGTGWSRE